MTAKGFTKKIISHALKRWPRGSSDDSYWRHWKSWCRTHDKCPVSDFEEEAMRIEMCYQYFLGVATWA